MLTRKYYRIIAQCIKDNSTNINKPYKSTINKDSLIVDLCDEFGKDNHLFNRSRFVDACFDKWLVSRALCSNRASLV